MSHLENYFEGKAFGSKIQCGKCARWVPRADLVRDGYTRVLTCRRCWDPEEEPDYPVRQTIPREPK